MILGVLASGRGSNLAAILRAVETKTLGSRVGIVLSDVPSAPALELARRAGVAAAWIDPGTTRARLTDQASAAMIGRLRDAEVDVVCLAGFMRILGTPFFEAYGGRILNIHPSLLPAFPGLHPQRRALAAGVAEAGCTVHVVTPEVDAGPILGQTPVVVLSGDTEETLATRILVEEHRLYVEVLRAIEDGRLELHPSSPTSGPGREVNRA